MKKKIVNDPVHGFITIPQGGVQALIDHPYLQRLRRIKQLGLTEMVYPGALHTRFGHALGAMHLMTLAMDTLRDRGYPISARECEAATLAILMHDIGHGPFSHALESSLLSKTNHEQMGNFMMGRLREQIDGPIDMAMAMFEGSYPRHFFKQLIASQLDCDRLDYLVRDSFYTGVLEGTVGATRMIKMFDLADEQLVVEAKGIYSVENFLNSRRVMYWQVYLHKTTICAEEMLIRVIKRARELMAMGSKLPMPEWLQVFFEREITIADIEAEPDLLDSFTLLDDTDIWICLKYWQKHEDPILSLLARSLVERRLFKVELSQTPPSEAYVCQLIEQVALLKGLTVEQASYLVIQGTVLNAAYDPDAESIKIVQRNGDLTDIREAADLPHIEAMAKPVVKWYLAYPK
jgi:uncharacterized protein